jgi:hypothetical protein
LVSLSFDIANLGQADAKNLRVELGVPGARYEPPIDPQPVPVGQRRSVNKLSPKGASWACQTGTGAVNAICTAPELAGLSTSTLTVRLRIAKNPVATEAANISLNVVSDFTAPARLVVASSPPAASRLAVGPQADPSALTSAITSAGAELAIAALASVSAGATPFLADADGAPTATLLASGSTSVEPVGAGSAAAASPAVALSDLGPVTVASSDLGSATGASPDALPTGAVSGVHGA